MLKQVFFSERSQKVLNDNDQTFVGAEGELRKLFDLVKNIDKLVVGYLSSEMIDWKFIYTKTADFRRCEVILV